MAPVPWCRNGKTRGRSGSGSGRPDGSIGSPASQVGRAFAAGLLGAQSGDDRVHVDVLVAADVAFPADRAGRR